MGIMPVMNFKEITLPLGIRGSDNLFS
jgi:hypothetical protein